MKFDVQILETMFNIVLKFHDQNLSVVEVITIPDIILKRYAAYIFIVRSSTIDATYKSSMNSSLVDFWGLGIDGKTRRVDWSFT